MDGMVCLIASEEYLEAYFNSTWLRPGWREIGIEGGNTYNYQTIPHHITVPLIIHVQHMFNLISHEWRHGQDSNSSLCPNAINHL